MVLSPSRILLQGRSRAGQGNPHSRKCVDSTEPENMACTWFGEICSCALKNSRNKFHQTMYKPYFRALYIGSSRLTVSGVLLFVYRSTSLQNYTQLCKLHCAKIIARYEGNSPRLLSIYSDKSNAAGWKKSWRFEASRTSSAQAGANIPE